MQSWQGINICQPAFLELRRISSFHKCLSIDAAKTSVCFLDCIIAIAFSKDYLIVLIKSSREAAYGSTDKTKNAKN